MRLLICYYLGSNERETVMKQLSNVPLHRGNEAQRSERISGLSRSIVPIDYEGKEAVE